MPLFHRAGIYLTLGMTVRRLFALRDVRPFSTKEYWLYLFPFTLHFGWITVIPPAVSQPHAASATGPSLFRSSCSAPTLKTSPKIVQTFEVHPPPPQAASIISGNLVLRANGCALAAQLGAASLSVGLATLSAAAFAFLRRDPVPSSPSHRRDAHPASPGRPDSLNRLPHG